MKKDWLWDRKISNIEIKKIFKNPSHPKFIDLSSLLLSRKNTPEEIFKTYLNPLIFCQNWLKIKRRMREDKWNISRIEFWQAVYEKLIESYNKKGIVIKKEKPKKLTNNFFKEVGQEIKKIRKQKHLMQADLARKMHTSQQVISRIERGEENISLSTLKKIAARLSVQIQLNFK